MILLEHNNIIYRLLTEEYLEETILFNTRHFIEHEYLVSALAFNYDEFEPFVRTCCQQTITDGLSLIAVDKISNKVIGFSICEDISSVNATDFNTFIKISDKYAKLTSILETLHLQCNIQHFLQGECYHLFLLGVASDYQGQKIGKTLVQLSGLHAKNRQYKYVLVEATSPMTKPICEKDGYVSLGNLPYKNFVYENEIPFKHIVDYDGPYIMFKRLV